MTSTTGWWSAAGNASCQWSLAGKWKASNGTRRSSGGSYADGSEPAKASPQTLCRHHASGGGLRRSSLLHSATEQSSPTTLPSGPGQSLLSDAARVPDQQRASSTALTPPLPLARRVDLCLGLRCSRRVQLRRRRHGESPWRLTDQGQGLNGAHSPLDPNPQSRLGSFRSRGKHHNTPTIQTMAIPVIHPSTPPQSSAGILLAGDAAALVDPHQGHGIDRALESGALAASVIRQGLAMGLAPAALSERYQQRLAVRVRGWQQQWQALELESMNDTALIKALSRPR